MGPSLAREEKRWIINGQNFNETKGQLKRKGLVFGHENTRKLREPRLGAWR